MTVLRMVAEKRNEAFPPTTPYKPSCSFGLAGVPGMRCVKEQERELCRQSATLWPAGEIGLVFRHRYK